AEVVVEAGGVVLLNAEAQLLGGGPFAAGLGTRGFLRFGEVALGAILLEQFGGSGGHGSARFLARCGRGFRLGCGFGGSGLAAALAGGALGGGRLGAARLRRWLIGCGP